MQGCQDSTGKWIKVEFHEIATLSKKKFNPQKQTMDEPCIELEHIEKETGRLLGTISSAGQLSTKNTFRIGDVLFGKLRPNLRKYINCDFSGVCSSEIWVLNAQKQTYSSFLFYLIQQEKFIRSACITSGSKMPRADWSVVSEVPFPLPPLPEQKTIADLPNQAHETLFQYHLTAPSDGIIIEKHMVQGELVTTESPVFIIADITSLWVDLQVYPKDLKHIKKGQSVVISADSEIPDGSGVISYIAPVVGIESRTALVRVGIRTSTASGCACSGRLACLLGQMPLRLFRISKESRSPTAHRQA